MKALVIYDSTGRIWSIIYGEETAPQGLQSMFVDIPDGGQLDRIDVTDPQNPKAVFTYLPESDIGRLQKKVEELTDELTQAELALTEQYELNLELDENITNTQLALVELYEGKEAQSMSIYIAAVYADLIRKGKKTIDEVPEKDKPFVQELLNEDNQADTFLDIKKGRGCYGNCIRNFNYQG